MLEEREERPVFSLILGLSDSGENVGLIRIINTGLRGIGTKVRSNKSGFHKPKTIVIYWMNYEPVSA